MEWLLKLPFIYRIIPWVINHTLGLIPKREGTPLTVGLAIIYALLGTYFDNALPGDPATIIVAAVLAFFGVRRVEEARKAAEGAKAVAIEANNQAVSATEAAQQSVPIAQATAIAHDAASMAVAETTPVKHPAKHKAGHSGKHH